MQWMWDLVFQKFILFQNKIVKQDKSNWERLPQLAHRLVSWVRHLDAQTAFTGLTGSKGSKLWISQGPTFLCTLLPAPDFVSIIDCSWSPAEPKRTVGMLGLCVEFHQCEPVVLSIWNWIAEPVAPSLWKLIAEVFKSLQSGWRHHFVQMQCIWFWNITATQSRNFWSF